LYEYLTLEDEAITASANLVGGGWTWYLYETYLLTPEAITPAVTLISGGWVTYGYIYYTNYVEEAIQPTVTLIIFQKSVQTEPKSVWIQL